MGYQRQQRFLRVKEVILGYPFTRYAVYELIKNDPTFPFINVGPKKNYRVMPGLLEEWLKFRLEQRNYRRFTIPTPEDLLKL